MNREVILFDRQAITRIGIEALIKQVHPRAVISSVDTKRALVERLVAKPTSVVILDYTLSDLNSTEGLLHISERFKEVDWLLFSDELSVPFLQRVVAANHAFSVVLKTSEQTELEEGLVEAFNGRTFLCSHVVNRLSMTQEAERDGQSRLTPTEQEILREIALGKTTKEIARARNISCHTLTTHRKNIFRKLHVNNAQEASRYALRSGILDASDYFI